MGRRPGRWIDSSVAKTYDVLWADGGWLTVAAIAEQVGETENTTQINLSRVYAQGMVDRRPRIQNGFWGHLVKYTPFEMRYEYSITEKGIEYYSAKLDKAAA